jgi:hypothetical protein
MKWKNPFRKSADPTITGGNLLLPEIAFYYPGHIWQSPDWIKSLLLFFDGVGLLVPEYKQQDLEMLAPELVGPLREKGLLHYLIADKVVDKEATQALESILMSLITNGAFDVLKKDNSFEAISMSRLGYDGDHELAEKMHAALKERGLAKDSEDSVSIPLHPTIRYLILTLLAQILRPKGIASGLALSPTTDRFEVAQALTKFLNLPQLSSAGHVVAFDLQHVSVDLAAVPLNEVLGFRTTYRREHREYMESIRRFSQELSQMPEHERAKAFADRKAKLQDLRNDLEKIAWAAWRKPLSFGLAIAGGFWTVHTGDTIGGLLVGTGALVGGIDAPANQVGAFNFIFSARNQFS